MPLRATRIPAIALCAVLTLPCIASAATAQGGARARVLTPVDEKVRIELPGHIHHDLRAALDLGSASAETPLPRLTLVLSSSAQQETALAQLLERQQHPGDALFRTWLSPAEFGRRFGVAAADLERIASWLRGWGFRIDALPEGNRSIVFSGNAAQLERAFHVHLHRWDVRGASHLAAIDNPSVPAAFAGVVKGFASLHDFGHRALHRQTPADQSGLRQSVPATGETGAALAAATNYTAGTGVAYLAPADFATIYDVSPLYARAVTGSGRSIAVLGRTSINSADLSNFFSAFGPSAALPTIVNNGPAPAIVSGDELESDLDLEWSAAIAPAARVLFVTSASTGTADGIDLSAQYAVSNNLADIISLSYGSCESASDLTSVQPYYGQLWQQAAAQGISVLVAAGDNGPDGCDDPSTVSTASAGSRPAVNLLCSSPNSTCVGGSEFSADASASAFATYWSSSNGANSGSALQYIPESVWNESGTVAGGSGIWAGSGGASSYYAKPAWQFALNVPSDGRRDVPDLALNAASAHDPYLVYTSDGFSTSTLVLVGGTSASAPSMAGVTALVAQQAGGRIGNLNPTLYALSTRQAAGGPAVFHRITSGNDSVPGMTGFTASTTTPDYSQAAGLGSPDAALLAGQWAGPAPLSAQLTPTAVTVPATAFTGSANLVVASASSWTATVSAGATSWLSVTPAGGTGSSVLDFVVLANPATSARSGTVSVGGQTLTITQAAASAASGNAGRLAASAASFNFGSVALAASSGSQRLYVSNSGNASLVLAGVSLSGSSATDFATTGSCLAALTLVSGASCYLDLSFVPKALGAAGASLSVTAASQSVSVSLSGTGLPAAPTADVPLPAWAVPAIALLLITILAQCASGARRSRSTGRR